MKLSMLVTICLLLLGLLPLGGMPVLGAMTSTNYEIRFDSLTTGGEDTSASASYQLRDSVGNIASDGASTNYQNDGGYREGVFDEVSTFSVFLMDRSSQTGASSLSSTTVTVSSASGYSTGDMIAVVQDEGASQVSAVGKITGVSGSDITVDSLDGGSPTIDGSGDVVYRLDATSYSLGSLSSSSLTTGIIAWEVDADVDDGYAVYVYEDSDLEMSGSVDTIADVADGSVTAGSSEYGAISSDTSLSTSTFDTQDTAFTTSQQLVGSRSSFGFDSRDFLTVKTAIDSGQTHGSYSHSLTFVYVGDY